MARTVILGAGIASHAAALHLRRLVGKAHDVVVVAPNSKWNWIPSNVWVGVGQMTVKQVTFPLGPIYARKGIEFHQALATELHAEGSADLPRPHVTVRYTDPAREGQIGTLEYDYLINATGPKLNFGATPGLGPVWPHLVGLHRRTCDGDREGLRGGHREPQSRQAAL